MHPEISANSILTSRRKRPSFSEIHRVLHFNFETANLSDALNCIFFFFSLSFSIFASMPAIDAVRLGSPILFSSFGITVVQFDLLGSRRRVRWD